jgi:hypothetical protein
MAVGTSRTDTSEALNVPDQHSPPPGYEAPIVCDGIVDLRSTCRAAWPAPATPNMPSITFAAVRRWYIKSIMTSQHPSHPALPIIPLG